MERSKSFHTLSASYRDQLSNNTNASNNNQNNNNSNNINENNNIINNNNNMSIANTNSMSSLNNLNINQTAMNLRKQLELQQTRLQRQQLHLSGSSDSINALKAAAAAAATVATINVKLPILLPTARTNAVIAAAAATAMRKKLLQRQRSTTQAEFVDEVDYAADLEIDEDDEDDYDDDDDDDIDEDDADDDNTRDDDGDIETIQHDDVCETRKTKTTQRTLRTRTTTATVEKGVYEEHVEIEKPTVASTTTVATAHKKRFLFQQRQPRNRAMPQFSNSAHCLPTQLQLNTNLTGNNNNNSNKQDSNNNIDNNSGHSTVPSTPTYKTGPGSKTRNSSTSSAISLDGRLVHGDSFDSATDMSSPTSRRHQFAALKRDNSMQSDSSRYSSVDSLLEARKPDPEAILINLGFGPGGEDVLSRIPKRFLKPSQVRGIDTDAFVKRLQLANTLADHSVLGYRGLTGNPDIPPSSIVAKIMQRFEVNERKKSMGSIEQTMR